MASRSVGKNGNTLALVAVTLGLLTLLVCFCMMNYNLLIGSHKVATSAIDAAALQAASDMARIVIDGKMGKVALVDDIAGGTYQRPVIGINTLLATVRLDALIGSQLGNKTIQALAEEDLQKALNDAATLEKAIEDSGNGQDKKDKNGNNINLKSNVESAYDTNALRLGTGQRSAPVTFTFGRLTDAAVPTSTPIPVPNNLAQLSSAEYTTTSAGTVYKAYTPISTPGLSTPISFVGLGHEPALVSNDRIKSLGAGDTPVATVVQVITQHKVTPIGDTKWPPPMMVKATAQCGGRNITFASSVLVINFPQGLSIGNNKVDFTSVHSIMNSEGKWDGSGSWSPSYRNRGSDDPSVALSCQVYDWVRSLGLRPDISTVRTVLDHPFINITEADIQHNRQLAFNTFLKDLGILPAWAQSGGNPWLPGNIRSVYPSTPVGSPNYFPGRHIVMKPANTAGCKREYFNGNQAYHISGTTSITDAAIGPSLKQPTAGYQTEYRTVSTAGQNYHHENGVTVTDGFDYDSGAAGVRFVDYLDAPPPPPPAPPPPPPPPPPPTPTPPPPPPPPPPAPSPAPVAPAPAPISPPSPRPSSPPPSRTPTPPPPPSNVSVPPSAPTPPPPANVAVPPPAPTPPPLTGTAPPPTIIFMAAIQGSAIDSSVPGGGVIKFVRCTSSPFPDGNISGQPTYQASSALLGIGSQTNHWNITARNLNGNNDGDYFATFGAHTTDWCTNPQYGSMFSGGNFMQNTVRSCPSLGVEWKIYQ